MRRLDSDGLVGEADLATACRRVGPLIFDCVDVFDGFEKEELLRAGKKKAAAGWTNTYEVEVDDIRTAGGKPFVIGGMSNGVEQAVSMICAAADEAFLLRFHAHGHSGSVGVASGRANDPSAKILNPRTRINSASLPVLSGVISRLKNIFGPYGSLQLMSCETARGKDGRDLLRDLALLVEVPVTAGIQDQISGGVDTFKFEGPTVTAIPRGQSLREWCRALPDFAYVQTLITISRCR